MIFHPTVWQRRHLWVWNLGNDAKTTVDWLATNAKRLGFDAVCIKVHDGAAVFHGPQGDNADATAFRRLKQSGLLVGGWGWLTGDGVDTLTVSGVEREAQRAVERCKTLGLNFYVADPESAYEFSPRDSPTAHAGNIRFGYSIRFVRAFSNWAKAERLPATFARAVASYGRADLHDLDWHAWSLPGPDGIVWRCNMQAYANESHALAVDLCVRSYERYWRRALIHPLLGVYEGVLGRHSAPEYAAELSRASTYGFGCYSADAMTEQELRDYGRVAVR